MAKSNWQNKNKKKKANDRRGKNAANTAEDALVEYKNPLYAYKILNNSKRPLVADNGKAIVILYDMKVFENVIFDLEENKTKVEDADDGVKTKGRKITKYKVASVSNFSGDSAQYDIFSRTPIHESLFDKTNLDIFTFEDNNGTFERDEVTNQTTVKTGEALSLISINSLPILKNQEIFFEVYSKREDIPQLKNNYKVKALGFRLPIKVGVGRITARAVENNVEINLDLKLDELKTTTNLFISKFDVKDEERYDQEESYISPFIQLNWNDAIKYFDITAANTILSPKDDNEKWILNLIYGLCALYYIEDSNYGSVTRDANGIINDSVRGFSLAKADEANDRDINTAFIEYCLTKITNKEKILLAYGYIAMLSKYIESKYTFTSPINEYAQLWSFELSFVYDETLKTIDNFSNEVKLKLFSNVYNIKNTSADADAPKIEILSIKDQFKNISTIRNIGEIITAEIEFIDDQLTEHDVSIYNGENENNDVNKYFAFHALNDYEKLTKYYSQEESEIHKTGEIVVKNIIKTYSLDELYRYFYDNYDGFNAAASKIGGMDLSYLYQYAISLGKPYGIYTADYVSKAFSGDWIVGASELTMMSVSNVFYKTMLKELNGYSFYPAARKWNYLAIQKLVEMKEFILGDNTIFGTKLNKELLVDFQLTSNRNGRQFKINTQGEQYYFVNYLMGELPDQDPLKNENAALQQTLAAFTIQVTAQNEYIYTQDVTTNSLSKNNRVVDEQKILDRQVILNDSNVFEFWTKFEELHAGQISSILELKLWTRYGGRFQYIKEFEYEDNDGNVIAERKEYSFDLSATHAIENALTTIFDQ